MLFYMDVFSNPMLDKICFLFVFSIRKEIKKHPHTPQVVTLKWLVEINGLELDAFAGSSESGQHGTAVTSGAPGTSNSTSSSKDTRHNAHVNIIDDSSFAADILDIAGPSTVDAADLLDPAARLHAVTSKKRKAAGPALFQKGVVMSSSEAAKAVAALTANISTAPIKANASSLLQKRVKQPKIKVIKEAPSSSSSAAVSAGVPGQLVTSGENYHDEGIGLVAEVVSEQDCHDREQVSMQQQSSNSMRVTRGSRLAARAQQQNAGDAFK